MGVGCSGSYRAAAIARKGGRAMWGRHSCLPAPARADRNVRATLGCSRRHQSPPVDTRRYPSAVPAVPVGSAVTGLEDEDEDEDEDDWSGLLRFCRPIFRPPTKRRDKVFGRSVADKVWGQSVWTKRSRQGVGTRCGDKVWRQGVETRCGDKVLERSTHLNPALKPTLKRHA
jgi:hypothetical protein